MDHLLKKRLMKQALEPILKAYEKEGEDMPENDTNCSPSKTHPMPEKPAKNVVTPTKGPLTIKEGKKTVSLYKGNRQFFSFQNKHVCANTEQELAWKEQALVDAEHIKGLYEETTDKDDLARKCDALYQALKYAVLVYGKPGGPWNVSSEPGKWIQQAEKALEIAEGKR